MEPRQKFAARTWALLAVVIGLVSGTSQSALAAGRKWPTDETVRSAMAAIRKATLDTHTLVTHRRMPPPDARRFAETIAKETARARNGALGQPAAKAELEPILRDIMAGAEAVAGRGGEMTAIDGIVRIDSALARYPLHFDDPTWQPLR